MAQEDVARAGSMMINRRKRFQSKISLNNEKSAALSFALTDQLPKCTGKPKRLKGTNLLFS